MYRNILLPVDGSAMSESALATAADVACRAHSRLHIVQVSNALEADRADSRFGMPNHLDALASRCNSTLGIDVVTEVLCDPVTGVDYTEPSSAIVTKTLREYIRVHAVDLTVMTTHGFGGFMRAWLGSVADELLRTAVTPVLAIKPVGSMVRPKPPIRAQRVLIPLDMSDRDQELIARTIEFGDLYAAEYTLLHVVQPAMAAAAAIGGDAYGDAGRDIPATAHAYLDRLAETIAATGSRARIEVTTVPFIASEIIAYAESHHFDLISVATRGRNPVARAVLGSVADKVVRGASMPVLVTNLRGIINGPSAT